MARCMLDTLGYNTKLIIGNTYCFSTTIVGRKHFNVTLRAIACLVNCSSKLKRYTMQRA